MPSCLGVNHISINIRHLPNGNPHVMYYPLLFPPMSVSVKLLGWIWRWNVPVRARNQGGEGKLGKDKSRDDGSR